MSIVHRNHAVIAGTGIFMRGFQLTTTIFTYINVLLATPVLLTCIWAYFHTQYPNTTYRRGPSVILLLCLAHWSLGSFVHYNDVIMSMIASQITSLAIVYSTVYSGADQRKHQNTASPAFVQGIQRGPVNSPHKGPVPRKMFPFDDVIMEVIVICELILVIDGWGIAGEIALRWV